MHEYGIFRLVSGSLLSSLAYILPKLQVQVIEVEVVLGLAERESGGSVASLMPSPSSTGQIKKSVQK